MNANNDTSSGHLSVYFGRGHPPDGNGNAIGNGTFEYVDLASANEDYDFDYEDIVERLQNIENMLQHHINFMHKGFTRHSTSCSVMDEMFIKIINTNNRSTVAFDQLSHLVNCMCERLIKLETHVETIKGTVSSLEKDRVHSSIPVVHSNRAQQSNNSSKKVKLESVVPIIDMTTNDDNDPAYRKEISGDVVGQTAPAEIQLSLPSTSDI